MGTESSEEEAFAEVERATEQLRGLIANGESGEARANVVSLVGRKPPERRGQGGDLR